MSPRRFRLLFLGLLLLLLPACQSPVRVIFFPQDDPGTELFKEFSLSGDLEPGADLTVAVTVNQAYPVPLRVACYYEEGDRLTKDQLRLAFEERAVPVGETILAPYTLPAGKAPDAEVTEQKLSFRFPAPEAGKYFIACLTPAAPENGMGRAFRIPG